MTSAHPQPDPRQRKCQGNTVSVAFPFELYRELARQAQLTGESVATCAVRLLSEALRELPPDQG